MKSGKLLPTYYFLLAILLMIVLHVLIPLVNMLDFPWTIFGIIPVACGIILNLIADGAFKKAKTTVKPFQESTSLVTTGVFSLSRNPMYLGFVLILIGSGILLGSLTPFIILPIFIVLINRNFISIEEQMLQDKFGKEWSEYKSKVRRWI